MVEIYGSGATPLTYTNKLLVDDNGRVQCVLYGSSGTTWIPVAVTGSGFVITASGAL